MNAIIAFFVVMGAATTLTGLIFLPAIAMCGV